MLHKPLIYSRDSTFYRRHSCHHYHHQHYHHANINHHSYSDQHQPYGRDDQFYNIPTKPLSLTSLLPSYHSTEGKALPLQAIGDPEGSRKLRLLDFLTTAQYGGRLLAFRIGRLYPQKCSRPQGHGKVGRGYVNEKCSDTTGNRSRHRPTSSAAP